MTVLWLSRHDLTPEQISSLEEMLGPVEITSRNLTWPSKSDEAIAKLMPMFEQFDAVAGVFPGHIAAALGRLQATREAAGLGRLPLFVPVQKPSPVRKEYVHSHWEVI